jgi:hypothetical protein
VRHDKPLRDPDFRSPPLGTTLINQRKSTSFDIHSSAGSASGKRLVSRGPSTGGRRMKDASNIVGAGPSTLKRILLFCVASGTE